MLLALAAAALAAVVSASYVLYDTDLWQHLAVGKAIWQRHQVPNVNLWTWHHWGEPQITPSWGFRVLLWPVWSWLGVPGLFAWRWVTTLLAFALAYATARVLGARGLIGVVVMAWCAVIYRIRTDLRPETLAAACFAFVLWTLTRRRTQGSGRIDRAWWIVPVAWAWANVHVSYYLGFLLLGVHLLDAHLTTWRRRGGRRGAAPDPRPATLWAVTAACVAISFLHPGGWRALAQPFEFALFWRDDPMFRTIVELQPLMWRDSLRSGLPLLIGLWPALALDRARRRAADGVELMLCAAFTTLAISSQRFVGSYALAAAPFVARDFSEVLAGVRAPRPSWARAGLAVGAIALIGLPEWTRPELPLGVRIDPLSVPEQACDFMAAHGVRGHGFNHLHLGGYQIWRFWPDRERLPMVSIHPEDTPPDLRRAFTAAFGDARVWAALDQRWHFDYVLLDHRQDPGDRLLDRLAADTSWAYVFRDDVADLLVRRGGALDSVARAYAYRVVPPGGERLNRLLDAALRDPAIRGAARAELERRLGDSPYNSSAHRTLAVMAMMDRRFDDARRHFGEVLRQAPRYPGTRDMLGIVALEQDRPADAVRDFAAERRLNPERMGIDYRLGIALARSGNPRQARSHLERELARDPGNDAARAALDSLQRGAIP